MEARKFVDVNRNLVAVDCPTVGDSITLTKVLYAAATKTGNAILNCQFHSDAMPNIRLSGFVTVLVGNLSNELSKQYRESQKGVGKTVKAEQVKATARIIATSTAAPTAPATAPAEGQPLGTFVL